MGDSDEIENFSYIELNPDFTNRLKLEIRKAFSNVSDTLKKTQIDLIKSIYGVCSSSRDREINTLKELFRKQLEESTVKPRRSFHF